MRNLRALVPAFVLAAAGGCTDLIDDSTTSDEGIDAGAGATDPDGDPSDDGQWAVVDLGDQLRKVHYEVVNGRAIWDGDLDLGPVERVRNNFFAGVTRDFSRRWPDGKVRFRFESSVSESNKVVVRAAHATLAKLTPVRFTELDDDDPSGDYVTYYQIPGGGGGISDSVGMDGGEQTIELHGDMAESTVIHEMCHALGLYHEQERTDAPLWVETRYECIADNQEGNFTLAENTANMNPYDYTSIMHYRTGMRCASPRPAGCTLIADPNHDGTSEEYCDTIHKTQPGLPEEDGMPIGNNTKLSRWDMAALWRMYGRSLASDEAGDHFGKALAVGDFNKDGFDDVAVGVPGEDAGEGVVMVFRGTSTWLVPWQVLRQSQAGGSDEPGDEFGAALAAGDIDRDGYDDLVVGAPGEDRLLNSIKYIDTGAVFVFRGTDAGLVGSRVLTQSDTGVSSEQTGDRFGTAVSLAALTGPKSSGWERAILVGAPYESNPTRTGTARSGAVFVFDRRLDPEELFNTSITNKLYTSLPAGARFGSAIASGRLDDDGNDDLAVGAPGYNGGSVLLYTGRLPVYTEGANAPLTTYRQALWAPSGALGFGSALDLGNARGGISSREEVLIGAPDTASAAGAAYLYEVTDPSFAAGTVVLRQALTQASPAIVEAGDRFGAAVLVANVDPASVLDDLIIGAPGENNGEGVVQVWRGAIGNATYLRMLLNTGAFPGHNEAGDNFGAALAAGDLDGIASGLSSDYWSRPEHRFTDLVVGHDGEAPDYVFLPEGPAAAGAMSVFTGSVSGLASGLSYSEQWVFAE